MGLREKFVDAVTFTSLLPFFLPGTKTSAAMEAKGWRLEEEKPVVVLPAPSVYRCHIFNPRNEEVQPWNREYLAAVREARHEVRQARTGPSLS